MAKIEGMMGYHNEMPQNMQRIQDPMMGTSNTPTTLPVHMMAQPNMGNAPYIEILEQPRARGLRFRYKCEGRSAGTIPGESSSQEHRTFPTIKICNYNGPSAIIVVSCVTRDERPRPHPHSLVGKDCKQGVCTVKLKGSNTVSFPSLGIQCATKKEIQESLKLREKIRVDPWGTGYQLNVNSIELSTVRLAFQAFLPDENGKYTKIVSPVASQCIYDKKAVTDLVICRLSKQSGSAKGGDEVFILCEKVTKDDIQVRFFEENKDEGVVWERYGSFGQQDVHRQVAIVFKTPEYRDQNIKQPVQVMIQLKRPSDEEVSDPKPFQYIPNDPDPDFINRKRKRKNLNFDNFFKDSKIPASLHMEGPSAKDTLKERLIKKANRNNEQTRAQGMMSVPGQYGMPQYSINNTGGAGMGISPDQYEPGIEQLTEEEQQAFYMENGLKQEVTSPQQQSVVMHDGQSYTEMTPASGQAYSNIVMTPKSESAVAHQPDISSVTLNTEGVVVENSSSTVGGAPGMMGMEQTSGSILSMLKDGLHASEMGINSLPSLPSAVYDTMAQPNFANNMEFLQDAGGMVAAEETVESINEEASN